MDVFPFESVVPAVRRGVSFLSFSEKGLPPAPIFFLPRCSRRPPGAVRLAVGGLCLKSCADVPFGFLFPD